ncbi:MAG TPA: CBS domain-containing protein [Pseudomonas xinjiangensis]|uniref:CBS domain-containing protein n=2 Tax=root TaxID=1 RepID=A0A7V1BRJ0_9GAMM|nr:CBS domain-containing protein [Halopseudomonas xinjiangensis]HEC48237.1 CBS domain-containing protein [Halopseudomonas xinjiangensis]
MLKIVKVRDYMSTDLICLAPDIELASAIDTLLMHKISGAPVVDSKKKLIGMLSESDCLKGILTGSYFEESGTTLVASVMSPAADTIDADADIIKAAEYFIEKGRRRLPVLENGVLVGQISRRDVLRAVKLFNDHGSPR